MAAFKKMKSKCVVVFVHSEQRAAVDAISPVVYTALGDEALGTTIPKLVITSPTQNTILGSMSENDMGKSSNFSKVARSAEDKLEGWEVDKLDPKKSLKWPVKGKKLQYKGVFKSYDGGDLVFTTGRMQKDKLGEGTKLYLELLSKQLEAARIKAEAEASRVVYEVEDWEGSSSDKSISAKFVSLVGDKITLEKADGEMMSFDVQYLSEESQKRARELAAKAVK